MVLISLYQALISLGDHLLLDHANFQLHNGERVGLIGRNGVGKSTFLSILAGTQTIDEGTVQIQPGLKIGCLDQAVDEITQGTVYEVVSSGLENDDNADSHFWEKKYLIDQVISRFSLNPDHEFAALSGGMKRRVTLAKALVKQPDLLLLDEPTNHLDLEAILWLESFLKKSKTTLVFITHDRDFLQSIATRIIDLDRGILTSYPGDYQRYLVMKQQALETEAKERALFDKKWAEEEAWIRQGIEARRTRNEGRVRALKKLREEKKAQRKQVGHVKIKAHQLNQSAQIIIEAENIDYVIDNKKLINQFSLILQRGDKIGIIGPNGCGKTTLIKLLLGELMPTKGTVKQGPGVEIAYIDQLRGDLDPNLTLRDNVGLGSDFVEINGQRRHIISYLQDFLFTPSQANAPIGRLSGGERYRVLLARFFTKPASLYVLDEPTNDLDLETIELLEAFLVSFKGSVIVVSHDRCFLNNVVASTVAYLGEGVFSEFIGGYEDFIRQRPDKTEKSAPLPVEKPIDSPPKKLSTKKLSYNEQRELNNLPKMIEDYENQITALQQKLADPDFYKQGEAAIADISQQLQQLETLCASAYKRWDELEN